MVFPETPSRQPWIPSYLYTSPLTSTSLVQRKKNPCDPEPSAGGTRRSLMIPAPKESRIPMHSPMYYAACTAGGIFSCGVTHMAVTPLDLVKCNMQINPAKYKSISSGFGVLLREQGAKGFFRGWVPTLLGYSMQGACKFGFYEFFKKYYSDIAGPENAAKYKTLIFLAGSASAEVIADIALCPFEAVKVRVQTQPGFARGLSDGFPKFVRAEGASGLYKGIVPLFVHYFELHHILLFQAVNKLGLMGLCTRGLPIRIVMIGTLTGAQWGIYDAFKVFVGLPTTGGGAPAPAPL